MSLWQQKCVMKRRFSRFSRLITQALYLASGGEGLMRHPKGFDRYLGQDSSCCLIAA